MVGRNTLDVAIEVRILEREFFNALYIKEEGENCVSRNNGKRLFRVYKEANR